MNYSERMTDPVGTPAVRETVKEDLYLSLMAFSEERGTASFNAWIFPLVGWIWWSIPVLVLGTLIALWPSRKARAVAQTETPAAGAPPKAGGEMNRGAA
jgi:cytochrome c-type biogenesis protein CcmF